MAYNPEARTDHPSWPSSLATYDRNWVSRCNGASGTVSSPAGPKTGVRPWRSLMSSAALLVVGLLLCFAGALSVRLAVLTAGFGVSWLLADAFGAGFGTGVIIGLAGAAVALILTFVLSHAVMFATGAIVGAVIGAKLYVVLSDSSTNWILAAVFTAAVALISGFLATRYQRAFLRWATAFGGAGLVLSGIGLIEGLRLGALHHPSNGVESAVMAVVWVALGLAGHTVQERLSRRGSEK